MTVAEFVRAVVGSAFVGVVEPVGPVAAELELEVVAEVVAVAVAVVAAKGVVEGIAQGIAQVVAGAVAGVPYTAVVLHSVELAGPVGLDVDCRMCLGHKLDYVAAVEASAGGVELAAVAPIAAVAAVEH